VLPKVVVVLEIVVFDRKTAVVVVDVNSILVFLTRMDEKSVTAAASPVLVSVPVALRPTAVVKGETSRRTLLVRAKNKLLVGDGGGVERGGGGGGTPSVALDPGTACTAR